MTTLIFVRHGLTQENLNYTLIGRTDVPLHPYGVMQADAVAEALRATQLDAVVSSPLVRCTHTANRIADKQGIRQVTAMDGLQEIDLGVVDGMSSFLAYQSYQATMDEALDATVHDFRFPQGESRQEALTRFQATVAELVQQHPLGTVCVVTHGGPLGLWLADLHEERLGRFRHWQPDHASITRVHCENGRCHLVTRNDTNHIPKELQTLIQQARNGRP